jgi:hypothetical protein
VPDPIAAPTPLAVAVPAVQPPAAKRVKAATLSKPGKREPQVAARDTVVAPAAKIAGKRGRTEKAEVDSGVPMVEKKAAKTKTAVVPRHADDAESPAARQPAKKVKTPKSAFRVSRCCCWSSLLCADGCCGGTRFASRV